MVRTRDSNHASLYGALQRFLRRELQEERNAVSLDADQNQAPPLQKIFVDVRALRYPSARAPADETTLESLPPGILHQLLEWAHQSRKVPGPTSYSAAGRHRSEFTNKFVVVGGPGQGKTTIGQYLAQILRAQRLEDQELTLELSRIRQEVLAEAKIAQLPLAGIARFPIRIVLNKLATKLSDGLSGINSILGYIRHEIRRRTDVDLEVETLRHGLAEIPWLVIFDGLDEVPPTSNRRQVLEAIVNFQQESLEQKADVMWVATTRPQGYQFDFPSDEYGHLFLAPLSTFRAIYCAQRLLLQRFPQKGDLYEELIGRLERAIRSDMTAGLMQSPLQVSIMATLVDIIGQPPPERWKLFHEYHRIIFYRELRRDIPSAEVLRKYEDHIPRIHAMVGYWLQATSEQRGHTEAKMPREQFHRIIVQYFRDKGYKDPESIVQEIEHVSQERLVLLVSHQDGAIGFELRSIQEFMAAELVMEGEDGTIRERHRNIAPYSHWRNTLMFAARYCAKHRSYLVDSIVRLCTELNEKDALSRVCLAGSQLAVDLLQDNFGRSEPNLSQELGRFALKLLEPPARRSQLRLGFIYNASLESLYEDEIKKIFERRWVTRTLGAWRVLFALIEDGVAWAETIAKANWPDEPEQQMPLLTSLIAREVRSPWLQQTITNCILELPLHLAGKLVLYPSPPTHRSAENAAPWIDLRSELGGQEEIVSPRIDGWHIAVPHPFVPERLAKNWPLLAAVDTFNRHPTLLNMVTALRMAETFPQGVNVVASRFAWWPLRECLLTFPMWGAELIRRAERGELGDTEIWTKAESRWRTRELALEDLQYMSDDRCPLHPALDRIGCPLQSLRTPEDVETAFLFPKPKLQPTNFRLLSIVVRGAIYHLRFLAVNYGYQTITESLAYVVATFDRSNPDLFEHISYLWDILSISPETDMEILLQFGRSCQLPRRSGSTAIGHYYQENPKQHDLLLLPPGRAPHVPLHLLALDRFVDTRHRGAAVLHALAHPDQSLDQIRPLLHEAQALEGKQPGTLEFAVDIACSSEIRKNIAEAMLLELNRIMEFRFSSKQSSIIDKLDVLFNQRNSELANPEQLRQFAM